MKRIALLTAATLLPLLIPGPLKADYFTVQGDLTWQDTGVYVEAGQTITFSASGEICAHYCFASHDYKDPRGCCPHLPDPCSCQGVATPEWGGLVAGVWKYSLVGKVGTGSGFYIGDNSSIVSSYSGNLHLACNDNCHPDNEGSFSVVFNVQGEPHYVGPPDTDYVGKKKLPHPDVTTTEADGVISCGDHFEAVLKFKNDGGSADSGISVEIIPSASGSGRADIYVWNNSEWVSSAWDLQLGAVSAGQTVTKNVWFYVDRADPCDIPSGRFIPRSPYITVKVLRDGQMIRKHKLTVSLGYALFHDDVPDPSEYGYTYDMTIPDCLRTAGWEDHKWQGFKVSQYGQYAVGCRDSDSGFDPLEQTPSNAKGRDPDTAIEALRNLTWRVRHDFKPGRSDQERRSDAELLSKRKCEGSTRASIGNCSNYTDLTVGLLRSVRIPSRGVRGPFRGGGAGLIGQSHAFAEAYIEPGRWVNVDTAIDKVDHKSIGMLYALAYKVPLANSNRYIDIDKNKQCDAFCYSGLDLWCTGCLSSARLKDLSSFLCYTLLPEYTATIGHQRFAGISYSLPEDLRVSLDLPVSAEAEQPFIATATIENASVDSLFSLTVHFVERLLSTDSIDFYDADEPEQPIPVLAPGEIDTLEYQVTPMQSGRMIDAGVVVEGDGVFAAATATQNVNQVGTYPDLVIVFLEIPYQVVAGDSLTVVTSVLDDSLKVVSDATVMARIVSYDSPWFTDSTSVGYSAADTAYTGVIHLSEEAPLGAYGLQITAAKPGWEADTLTEATYVVPGGFVLDVSGPDSLSSTDSLVVTAELAYQDSANTDGEVFFDIITIYGTTTLPASVGPGGDLSLRFLPSEYTAFADAPGVPPGEWGIKVRATYHGVEVDDSVSTVVRVPDLEPSSGQIGFMPGSGCIRDSSEYFLLAKVLNVGDAAADSAAVQFWLDSPDTTGILIDTTPIRAIDPGDSTLVIALWDSVPSRDVYEVFMLVDAYSDVSETDESNNVSSRSICSYPSADLAITEQGITISPGTDCIVDTLSYFLRATVINGGDASSDTTYVRFAVSGGGGSDRTIGDCLIPPLDPEEVYLATVVWDSLETRSVYEVTACVDWNDEILEEYEFNNQAERSFCSGTAAVTPLANRRALISRPNPFRDSIEMVLSSVNKLHGTRVEIYNVRGQLVRDLPVGEVDSGVHSVTWDARDNTGADLPAGVYFYRVVHRDGHLPAKKVVLIR
jgi:hypothetical protein